MISTFSCMEYVAKIGQNVSRSAHAFLQTNRKKNIQQFNIDLENRHITSLSLMMIHYFPVIVLDVCDLFS